MKVSYLSPGDHLEKETISDKLRWGLIGILFVIFIFVILGIFEVFVGVGLVFFVALPFGGVSLILNGRRFIKYRKWYFNPSSFDMLFYKNEETLALTQILVGILCLIFFVVLIVWAIFGG